MLHSYWLENGCLIFLNIFLYVCLHLLNAKRKPQVSRLSSKNFLKLESGSWRYEFFFTVFSKFGQLKRIIQVYSWVFFFNAYLIFSPPSRNDSANVLGAKNRGTVRMQHPKTRGFWNQHLQHIDKFLLSVWLHKIQHKNMIFFRFQGLLLCHDTKSTQFYIKTL